MVGYLPKGSLSVLYGPSGCGKTFVALDLALSLASGRTWWGAAVEPCLVAYLALEGLSGLGLRTRAWIEHWQTTSESLRRRFLVSCGPVSLGNGDAILALMTSLDQLPEPPGLIVIDTLARAIPGVDENSARELGQVISNLDVLRHRTGAAILLVHHVGKDATKGARGSSALQSAADAAFEVTRHQKAVRLACTKMKDWEAPPPLGFRLRSVGFSGETGEKRPSTSAVIEALETPKLTPVRQLLVNYLLSLGKGEWTTLAAARNGDADGQRCSRQAFNNAAKRLETEALIERNPAKPGQIRLSDRGWTECQST